jgi:ATP/maltotriose-dependent transcriptional regulator MalT
MTDDQLLEKGTKAEQAKEYLEGLIKEATDRLSEQLLNLYPDETIKFSVIRSQMMSLHDILLVVEADIREGQNALERIQNPVAEQKGGIL